MEKNTINKWAPCPFCGGKVKPYSERDPDLHGFIHLCEINGDVMFKIESRLFLTEEAACAAWNNRMEYMGG